VKGDDFLTKPLGLDTHKKELHPFFRSELLRVPLAMVVVPHGGGGELMDGGGGRPHLG
jgi:hypothetical protein